MASSGKKNKKAKGKTLALNDFLQETPGAAPTVPIRKSTGNWADEVEDSYDTYESRGKSNVVLPTAPKAARGLDDYSDKIPQQPPYSAYLSNLPYDVSEDEIADFFSNLRIAHMRIPKDERPGEMPKLKGFGYIEFEDRESLVGALALPDCTLKNRRIRIEVATNSENDRRRGGRMEMSRDRSDRPDTFTGDWRSGPRADPVESDRSERRGGGGGGGSFSRDREQPIERGWRESNDRPSFRDSDKDRPFSRDYDRGDRGGMRDNDRGGRFGDRDNDRRGFQPRRSDRDDRNGGFTRGPPKDDLNSDRPEPRTRPKLVLAPRTKPLEQTAGKESDSNSPTRTATAPVPATSIFGNAKPVDTSARERQIEERLAKETEKITRDPSVEKGRDIKREDMKNDESIRRSPRRMSSERRTSPDYNHRRRSSDRRRSPDRRSPDRRRSPKRRRSPERKRSYERKRSPERRRSPDKRQSSDRRSPDRRSPIIRRSPSPIRRKGSQSPVRRRGSPELRKNSPDANRRGSPDIKNRGPPPRRNDDKDRKHFKNDKPPLREKDKSEKIKHRDQDREMPKLKEPEPPNFAASNKYAFLQPEGDSD